MKKPLFTLKNVLILLISFSGYTVSSQCMITYNPASPQSTNNTVTFDYAQSFTATCSGNMDYFQLTSADAGTLPGATLNIYDGNVSSGTPIYTQAYPNIIIATAGDPITIDITGTLPLVSGNQYTFRFTATTLNFLYLNPANYSGGNAWQGGSALASVDFVFNVSIIQTPCTPTSIIPDVAALSDANSNCPVTIGTAPTATNSCGDVVNGVSNVTFPIETLGTTVVTWTYDDGEGNTTSQNQNVIINALDVNVDYTGGSIVADLAGAAYQWLDCNNSYADINGEISQTFTPTMSGSYAVEITLNGCSDTSICTLVNLAGIKELTDEIVLVYPNPSTNGVFTVELVGTINELVLFDMFGRIIEVPVNKVAGTVDTSGLESGKYLVQIRTNDKLLMKELVIVQ